LSRPRVIKQIETFDDAVKAERDVESGYDRVIDEHITYWIAVEEDIVDSYSKLIAQTENPKIRATLGQIVADSRRHADMLRSVAETLRKIMLDEEKHARLIQQLAEEAHREQSSLDGRDPS
jgi:bacterioferritin (cytochrome b1)